MWWCILWGACRPETVPVDDTDHPCDTAATTLELGSRDAQGVYAAFTPGQAVHLGAGPQHGGAWHLTWGGRLADAPQAVRTSATLTDVATGAPLTLDHAPDLRAVFAVPEEPSGWSCEGLLPDGNTELDAHGLDADDSVPVWREVCGRAVRLDVTLRDATDTHRLAEASVELVLLPPPEEGETCP